MNEKILTCFVNHFPCQILVFCSLFILFIRKRNNKINLNEMLQFEFSNDRKLVNIVTHFRSGNKYGNDKCKEIQ